MLTLAIEESWSAIPAGFLDLLDAQRASPSSSIDPWANIYTVRRGVPPHYDVATWRMYKDRLYTHIHEAAALYDGKDVPVTRDDYARAIITEGQRARDDAGDALDHPVITPRGITIALATALVESNMVMYANNGDPDSLNYPHEKLSTDANSVGLFQQRAPWWGTVADRMDAARSAALFYHALAKLNYNSSGSPGSYAQAVQQSAYPDRYDGRFAEASALYDRLATGEIPMGWTGDPVWLEDVLRPALGDRLKTLPGWQSAGHGDFKDIRGVMVHHTGNSRETAQSIRNGRPDLPGPLANLHIAPDGTVTIVAAGVCWHAGVGSYPWLPTNNANWHMIGIECAWPDVAADGSYNPKQRWPDAQIISMRDTCAALATKLAVAADHVIGHKDYAGAAQGKWDPGNWSTAWFQGEVAKDMRGEFGSKPPVVVPPPAPVPPPILPPPPNVRTDRQLMQETWDQMRGPGGNGWDQLGGKSVVDFLAELGRKVDQLGKDSA